MLKGPSYADKALCKQAHWFIYSKACPPLSTFRDPKFLEMLAAMVPPDSNYKGKPPILTIPKLKRYVDAEYELMKAEIHKLVHSKHHQSQGNAFGQLIHDGCTLDNGIKVQSVGLQMVSRNFDANHVICLCCQESKQNRGADVASLLQEVVLEMTGMNLITICGIAVQDRAALSVPAYLGFGLSWFLRSREL